MALPSVDGQPIYATDLNSAYTQLLPVFGGTGAEGNFTAAGGETITGVHNYANFTVGIGLTVHIGDGTTPWAIIKCTGNVLIQGTLEADAKWQSANDPEAAVAGWGVLGMAPCIGGANANLPAGGGVGKGGGGIGFGGAKGMGMLIIKTLRGWYVGCDTQNSGGQANGGGTILIECLGTVTISGTVTANGGDGSGIGAGVGGGGSGMIGVLSVGAINCSGGTLNAIGGNGGGGGGGGGGAIVFITQGTFTAGTTSVLGGTGTYQAGEDGTVFSSASSSAAFTQRGWALGD